MPLSVFDYLNSILVGVGIMGWFNFMIFAESKWHKITKIEYTEDPLSGSISIG